MSFQNKILICDDTEAVTITTNKIINTFVNNFKKTLTKVKKCKLLPCTYNGKIIKRKR